MKNIFYILSLILFVNSLKGQITNSEGNYSPANPNVSSLGKFIDIPVNHATGVPNISIPIHSLSEGEVSLGVSLSYHGSGIKVATPSSSTGAGWAINAGGMVTRSIEGIADDLDNFAHDGVGWYHMDTIDFSYWKQGNPYQQSPRQLGIPDSMRIPWKRLNNGVVDNGPDIFSYITPNGFSGKFYFDENKEVVFIDNKHNLKIEFVTNGPFNTFSSIIITDNTGTKFTYGETAIEYTHGKGYELTHPVNYYIPKTWRLVKIENYNETDEINLTYENDYYGYFYANNSSRSITYSGARPEFCIPDLHSVPHEGLMGSHDIACMYDGVHSIIKYTNSLIAYNQSLAKIYFANKKEYSVVLDKRLHKITTSDQEIEFSYQNTREDLTPYNVIPSLADSAQSLDEILIKNIDSVGSTTGCKKFKFAYSYFEDPTGDPNVTDDAKKRLKLNSLQEISCANPSVYIPPFVFDYHEQLLTGNISYFPNRLSKQIDHWGYHNGKQLNDWLNDPLNMPTVAVKDQHGDVVYSRESQVDRESDEASMLIGTLKSITYPTGGKTEFDFEANKAYREVPQLQILTEFTADDNSDNDCTNGTSVQSYGFDTKSTYQNSLIDFYVEKTCHGITPSQNYNPAVAIIEILDQNNNTIKAPLSVSTTAAKKYLYNGLDIDSILNSFASNQIIRFKISVTGGVCGIRIYQRDTLINANAAVGGLRIKSTTLNEGTAPAVTTNYAYTTFNSSGYESSAVLLQNPYYGRAVTDYVVGTTDPHIQIVEIRERPFLPLSDIEGRTVVYTNVTQSNALGEVNYYVNSGDPISTYFSSFTAHLLPSKYDSKRGVTDSVLTFNASGVLVQKTVNHYNKHPMSSGTPNLSKMPFKHEPAPGAVKTADDTYLWWYNTYAFPRLIQPYLITANYTNLVKTISTTYNELGQEPITDIKSYTYDNYNNLKASYTWREIDGDATLNGEDHLLAENYYVYDGEGFPSGQTAVQTALENKNMLGVPFKTTTKYQRGTGTPQIIGGSKTEMNFFNGGTLLLPQTIYDIQGGNFYPTRLFDVYNNSGLPTRMKTYIVGNTINTNELDSNYIEMTWKGNFLNSTSNVTTLGTQTDYYFYNNRNLLETKINHNSLETKFEYDELGRLYKIHEGKSVNETTFRTVTENTYHYVLDINGNIIPGAKNEVVTSLTFAPEVSGNTLTQQTSRKEFDQLGRLIQTQKDNFNPDGTDAIMSEVTYDNLGRVATQKALGTDPVVYHYETSPLSRALSQTGPTGTISNSSGHNTSLITTDNITYPIGTLTKIETTDVDGGKTVSYTDFQGNLIETQKEVTIQGILQIAKTKNIYNDLGQLIKVIPPSGNPYEYTYNSRGWLKTNQHPNQVGPKKFYYDKWGRAIGSQNPNGLILVSKYDNLGRVVQTGSITNFVNLDPAEHLVELPSSGLTEVYNIITYKLNGTTPTEMVESESTVNMSTLNQPTPTFYTSQFYYDPIGRPTLIEADNHRGGVEKTINHYNNSGAVTQTSYEHNTGNTIFGEQKILNWSFQYDHSLRPTNTILEIGNSPAQLLSKLTYNNYNQLIKKDLHEVTPNNYWQSIDYTYDNAGRLIKINDLADVNNENCLADNYCDLNIQLDCSLELTGDANQVVYEFCDHIIDNLFYVDSALGEISINAFTYPYTLNQTNASAFKTDLKAWLDSHSFKYDQVLISPNLDLITITQTNAPITKAIQGSIEQEAVLSNCCGQVPNNKLFAENIIYPNTGSTITSLEWATTCNGLSKYVYNYDELKRLKSGTYFSAPNVANSWSYTGEYDMDASYDLLGNIKTLNRKGMVGGSSVQIDNLAYNYNTLGRLSDVTDGVGNNYTNHGQKGNTAYTYDNNGNAISELSKGINITYNEFNLPLTINKISNGDLINNVYSGNSNRIQKVSTIDTNTSVRDYIGGFQYVTENGITKLEGYYYSQGRLIFKNGINNYEYSLSDHLGNVRLYFTDRDNNDLITKTDIIQQNHFYPFGLALEGFGSHTIGAANAYMYNDKEMDAELGLDWYNYGARFYDPAVARWHSVDKLSADPNQIDKSSYAYVWNNPISLNDPDGNCPICLWAQRFRTKTGDAIGKFLLGIGESAYNTLDAVISFPAHLIMEPGKTLNGLASTVIMFMTDGNAIIMMDIDEAIGTNSLQAYQSLNQGIDNTFNNLASGDPQKMGKSITDVFQIIIPIALEAKATRTAARAAEAAEMADMEAFMERFGARMRERQAMQNLLDEVASGDFSRIPIGDEIAGFQIVLNATIESNVYKAAIPGLFTTEGVQTSIFTLVQALEARALSQGATMIEITGLEIINPKLFNPAIAQRLGYTYTKTSDDSILLTKSLSD